MNNNERNFHMAALRHQKPRVSVSIEQGQITQKTIHFKIRFNSHVKFIEVHEHNR
jgi:hypothetical protein